MAGEDAMPRKPWLGVGLMLALALGCDEQYRRGEVPRVGAPSAERDAGIEPPSRREPPRNVFRPAQREYDPTRLSALTLPAGFRIGAFAQNLANARMLAVAPDASVYVTRFEQGDVIRLVDADADGEAESVTTVVAGIEGVHGIAIHDDQLYLASVRSVLVAQFQPDGSVGTLRTLVDDLPDGGQHPRRTLGFGPDDKLYVSVGSSCDACPESNPEAASLLQMDADGSNRSVFARGLRNTLGFAWHPTTAELWGSDHGSDWRGDDEPPDELNRIQRDGDYGWPYCFGDKQVDPVIMEPTAVTKEEYCAQTLPAEFEYPAHSAPIGLAFYTGTQFPEAYLSSAFVAFRGSWNRHPATGYEIARIRFAAGEPVALEAFVSGFLIEDGQAQFARLAGVAVAADGALLFSDDSNGVVYRVAYDDGSAQGEPGIGSDAGANP
jgi:glucose/arabinose dehydrogenase